MNPCARFLRLTCDFIQVSASRAFQAGANVNAQDELGNSPLHEAVSRRPRPSCKKSLWRTKQTAIDARAIPSCGMCLRLVHFLHNAENADQNTSIV
jgi:hypothetical protein